ncbi:bifunctional glycosyltransferase/CDP-glycerol:glycerophosphate glycerophosphotransferase [Jidongwangia harbinensis]|uniref:bifunctional glycosyltransferase/CDP-glycerol:glycerophosphate glycerophosphotransferase n=1 Tax=Jidongwangia harbinensis TaxID=2878561 RepID=UPI001CD9C5AB|nr:bifunctional glycosyltransferase family 2 protein/CDP-glycerol:glycerophosphate glycerophosphotransferase [Jidongwangia harbinensis]MCA2214495.1 bifunctional glycosyltransferase family 2 protein/CDP-glycerol:glycerophosphate glycerophosphotransferase [Jidongwangia harbinensis]
MTLLSVVLPVYKVQGYLGQCLDSLLDQSFTDFEIVAVDDCSPDGSGEILAEYAARDPRVRVVSLTGNVGLGRARNAGLDAAAGEYVWFIDSDDWVAGGALGAVARRLRAVEPDVLLVGFDRVHWDGRVVGSARAALAKAPEVFTVEQYPRVLDVLHVAWNKIVRRDLLAKTGIRFAPGWYEDVSFTYPLLAVAERISTLPRVCVHYRQRRTGAITRTLDDRHFEIFDHWTHALELVDEHSDRGPQLRPLLVRRMLWHYLVVLDNQERLARGSRKRFFARMHEDYRRYVPATGYPAPKDDQVVRHRLVERGWYPAYQAWEIASRVRTAVAGATTAGLNLARTVARKARQGVFQIYYRGQLRLPVDQNLAVFAAYWFRGVSCNPAAVAAKATELVPGLRAVWVISRARVGSVPPGTDYVVAGTLRYYRTMARARWLVNNVNWPRPIVKRRGTTHVMTHHGTPLKMMGLDQVDHPAAATDRDFAGQMRRVDRWDYSITANRHTTVAWERAYPARHETLEVGYPRNDRLAVATAEDTAGVRAKLGLSPDRTVVLYTPTHREWLPPGTPTLDVEDLADRLGPDTVLLVRAHYFHVAPATVAKLARQGSILDVSAYPVVEDLYLAADVLITDYSSAMFDYAVLDRPVVIYAPDWAAYRALRGVYFDLLAQPPGAVATSYPDLVETLRSGVHAGPAATAARAAFRARFCGLDDGGAAERVVRRVWFDGKPR